VTADDPRAPGHLGDALSALLDGELDDAAAEAARAHLAGCQACETERAAIGQARSWLRGLPPVEPPTDLYERLLAASPADTPPDAVAASSSPHHEATVTSLADARRHRHRWRAGVAAMSACAAVTLVVLGIAAPHEPSTSPPLGRFIAAHESEVGVGDPVSELATAVVPAGFSR